MSNCSHVVSRLHNKFSLDICIFWEYPFVPQGRVVHECTVAPVLCLANLAMRPGLPLASHHYHPLLGILQKKSSRFPIKEFLLHLKRVPFSLL